MAPFDAGFIQDEALQIAVRDSVSPVQGTTQITADYDRFGLGMIGMTIEAPDLEELLTAPALRSERTIESFLQRLDANGALTSLFFVGAYLALISAT